MIEEVITKCPICNEDVVSLWTDKGCLSRPLEYYLIADYVCHAICFDKELEKYNNEN